MKPGVAPGLVGSGPDRSSVGAAYDARVDREARADFLLREAELRMFDRLGFIRLDPVRVILDVGCGLGDAAELLGGRFDGARYIGVDLAQAGLRQAVRAAAGPQGDRPGVWKKWLARVGFGDRASGDRPSGDRAGGEGQGAGFSTSWVAADAHALPFASGTVDLVWSNLAAHWFDDPVSAVAQWRQVLRPGGLLMFSLYGVDTLREARPVTGPPGSAPASDGRSTAPGVEAVAALKYPDLHDWGDALVAAGFADPVMDVERLTLTYADAQALERDAKAISAGFGEPSIGQALPEGGAVTIELVYGHAWRPLHDRRDDGLHPVRIVRRGAPDGQERGR